MACSAASSSATPSPTCARSRSIPPRGRYSSWWVMRCWRRRYRSSTQNERRPLRAAVPTSEFAGSALYGAKCRLVPVVVALLAEGVGANNLAHDAVLVQDVAGAHVGANRLVERAVFLGRLAVG